MGNRDLTSKARHLSEAILETLKELSAAPHAITPVILHDALLKRHEFAEFVGQASSQYTDQSLQRESSPVTDNHWPIGHVGFALPSPPFQEPSCPVLLRRLQDECLSTLSRLSIDPGAEHSSHLLELRGAVGKAHDMERLIDLSEDTISLLRIYTHEVNGELSRFMHLMAEVGKNLMEMEKHLFSSFSHAKRSYDSNSLFNLTLDEHVQGIAGSLEISRTLAELRAFVVDKLEMVRQGIEAKRKEDEFQIKKVTKEMKHLKQRLVAMKDEMTTVRERTKTLEQELLLDPLTGIHNRRAYEQRLEEELKRYQRYKQPFAMLLIDLDHFKSINDRHGHYAGDRCLVEITRLFSRTLRETDFLARYGGEEFIALLVGIQEDGLIITAERVRKSVESARFLYQGEEIPITISVGATCVLPDDPDKETLFNRVDSALYDAKNGGRNRVVIK